MQVIRQRRWVNPPPDELAWRATGQYCVTQDSKNTGYKGWTILEEYNVSTGVATGNIKANNSSDPDYIAPVQDENACPLPEPEYAWRGIDLQCVTSNGQNTGYQKYNTLEEYDVDTLIVTGNTKPNVSFDPDYIAPIYNETACPLPVEPEYIWEPYEPFCIIQDVPEPKPLTNDTQIAINFDASGSMNDLYPVLEAMVDGALWNKLSGRYNSFAEYKEKVKVFSSNDERFVRLINDRINEGTSDLITLSFYNESFPDYYVSPYTSSTPLEGKYDYDINRYYELKNQYAHNLDSVIFQMDYSFDGDDYEISEFKKFLTYLDNGVGNYAGTKGFSNNENIKMKYDVPFNNTIGPEYYANIIIQELNALGFDL